MDERQSKLVVAKTEYRTALRNLESISEEIHAQRRSVALGTREQGVGAEKDTNEDITNFKMDSDGLSSKSWSYVLQVSCNTVWNTNHVPADTTASDSRLQI